LANVAHQHVITRKGKDMSNPVAHLACANNAYPFNCHGVALSLPAGTLCLRASRHQGRLIVKY
jgi:hypothetical protein